MKVATRGDGEISEGYCIIGELTVNPLYCHGRSTTTCLHQLQSSGICYYTGRAGSEEKTCPTALSNANRGTKRKLHHAMGQSHLITTRAETRAHGGEASL